MKIPTRDEFIAAVMRVTGQTPEDAGKTYDLLTGPPEAFREALREWAETRGREITNPIQPTPPEVP